VQREDAAQAQSYYAVNIDQTSEGFTMLSPARFCIKLLTWLALFVAGSAGAATVMLDFEGAGGSQIADYFENGFRAAPNCHYDFLPSGGFSGSAYLAIDRSGCGGGGLFNAAFPGPSELRLTPTTPFFSVPAALWIDASGQPFSLLDLYSPFTNWTLLSSNGGVRESSSPADIGATISFSGGDWEGLQWLLFAAVDDPGAPLIGIDRLHLRVPEPGLILLVGLGLALVGLASRRSVAR